MGEPTRNPHSDPGFGPWRSGASLPVFVLARNLVFMPICFILAALGRDVRVFSKVKTSNERRSSRVHAGDGTLICRVRRRAPAYSVHLRSIPRTA